MNLKRLANVYGNSVRKPGSIEIFALEIYPRLVRLLKEIDATDNDEPSSIVCLNGRWEKIVKLAEECCQIKGVMVKMPNKERYTGR
jgi:hypothetical protein